MTTVYRNPRTEATRRMAAVRCWSLHRDGSAYLLGARPDGDDVVIDFVVRTATHQRAPGTYRVHGADIDRLLAAEAQS